MNHDLADTSFESGIKPHEPLLEIGRTGIELDDLAARVEALENPTKSGDVSLSMLPSRIERLKSN